MNPPYRNLALVLLAVLAVHAGLQAWSPETALASLRNGGSGLAALAGVLPPVLLLIALFDAWVPRELVERNLGPTSGVRGIALALMLGTAAAGPLYAAFPVGLSLRGKGARLANLVIFLGAWATIKIPMLLMEGAFIGLRFAVLRLGLTLPGIIATGFLMERLCDSADTGPRS